MAHFKPIPLRHFQPGHILNHHNPNHHPHLGHMGDLKHIEHDLMDSVTHHGMSWKNRIRGYIACFVLGNVLALIGSICLQLHNGLFFFAAFFSTGTLVSMGGTFFLRGPRKQIAMMFSESRWVASTLVLTFLALSLMAAIWLKDSMLTMLFVCCQSLALTWYSFTNIPFAKDAAKRLVSEAIRD